jgi:putative endonuclease
MYYVYVLRSKTDRRFYVGYTADLRKRVEQHSDGIVESTRNRRPLELIYYEACVKQQDALHREKYLKTAYGKRYIRNRLKEFLHALD